MTDRLSPEHRSWNMSRIRSRDTSPERVVRSLLHRLGYRFRLHRKDLPGSPDIVLSRYRVVIFVHGCFWHRHRNCRLAYKPKSRIEFWEKKFSDNVRRDTQAARKLRTLGWRIVTVWECQTRHLAKLQIRLSRLLSPPQLFS
jgi:DNA mismatch endonuclease (patch repair protein)